jgi:hypothetical protein
VKDGQFDLPRLINDDYFSAIKLLFNATHYVSAAKLLMSFIDTVAFIDAGDVHDGFSLWLDTYADMPSLGITAKELWQFRNGLLHMTNLRSRAVASGNTRALAFYVSGAQVPIGELPIGAQYFSLKGLLDVIAVAIARWIESYNTQSDKWVHFVSRYDLTISDSRVVALNSR